MKVYQPEPHSRSHSSEGALADIRNVEEGYSAVAPYYDAWHWQRFWSKNEVPHILRLARKVAPWARTGLDFGTGTGRYSAQMASGGLRSVGVDISDAMLRVAESRARKTETFYQADLRAVPVKNGFGDIGFCCRVLSHLSSLDESVNEFARVIRPGGYLLLSEVHHAHNYANTRVSAKGKADVLIETYKHSPMQIAQIASRSRKWSLVYTQSFSHAGLLWKPSPSEGFSSIDISSLRPIFSVLLLRRR